MGTGPGDEQTPNGFRMDPERTPNGLETDPERILHEPRTDPNGLRTDFEIGTQTEPVSRYNGFGVNALRFTIDMLVYHGSLQAIYRAEVKAASEQK